MAKLPNDIFETIWRLKRQLADVIDNARTAEFSLFDTFGETERTMVYLDELQSVAEQATEAEVEAHPKILKSCERAAIQPLTCLTTVCNGLEHYEIFTLIMHRRPLIHLALWIPLIQPIIARVLSS